MTQQIDIFVGTLQTFWSEIALFFPKLMAAMILLALGWLLARLAKSGIKRLLNLVSFGNMAERSGLEALARSGGVNISLAEILSDVVYWLVILVVAVSVANSLGLAAVADLLNRAVLYLPNVLVAIVILVAGTLIARMINRLVFAWLNGLKYSAALTFSTAIEYVIQVFAFFLALVQLDIGTQLITAAFSIAFGGLVFGLALAFGLGGKEWATERIREWSSRNTV
jgi:hypothetical protein